MTTITTTIRPVLAERQNNYDPRTHSTKKDGGKPTPQLKLRVQSSPATTEPTTPTPSATTTTAATPKKTPSQQQKKAKKQAQIPVLKTDDSYATVTKKKVYSKEFLNQYRTVGDQSFAPGAAPADLIRMYNEAFEKKEQAAKAAEIAGVSNQPRPVDPSRPNPVSAPTTPANKEEEKRKKRSTHNNSSTTIKSSKFKFEGDESLFSKPFANTHSYGVKIPARPDFDTPVAADKENVDGSAHKRTPSNKKQSSNNRKTPNKDHAKSNISTPTTTNDAELLQKLTDLMQLQKTPTKLNDTITAIESSDDNAASNGSDPSADAAKPKIQEQDPRRLAQRQKQIDFGKVTAGYKAYTNLVPKCKRKRDDAKTPNKFQVCSKRSWDGQIRKWRRQLHNYDPEGTPMPADEGDDEDDDGEDEHKEGGDNDIKVEGGDE